MSRRSMYQLPLEQKMFSLKKEKSNCWKKTISIILGYAITVHNSQGSTMTYMQGDLIWCTGKKIATGKNYQQAISQGQFYTVLSCAKINDKFLLLNFEPEVIK